MNIHVNLEPFYQTEPGTAKEAPPLDEMVEEKNRKTRPDSVAWFHELRLDAESCERQPTEKPEKREDDTLRDLEKNNIHKDVHGF